MASAVYTVEVDFDKDSTYGHALSDVTSYVLDMQWNNGMANSEMEFANPAVLRLTLDNSAGDFNPDENSATFYDLLKKGMLVRIRATYNSNTHTLYIGKIRELPHIDVPTFSDQTVQLTASGYMEELLNAEFYPVLQTNVTTDVALQQVFALGSLALPYASNYWILGSTNASLLDTSTYLLDHTTAYSFDTGIQTLTYVGDASGSENTVRAQQFMRDVVAAEMGGRFWYSTRDGKFRFSNRHQDINPLSTVTIAGDDYDDATYNYQGVIYNDVTVHYYPRSLGSPNSILWTLADPVALAPEESKTITARFQDPDQTSNKIAAIDCIAPIAGSDYTANSKEDGTGKDRIGSLSVSVAFAAQSATVTLTNAFKKRIYVTSLQLRGTPLKTYDRQSVQKADADSIESYDRKPQVYNIKYVDSEDPARGYVETILAEYKDPVTRFTDISFTANNSSDRMTQALLRQPGDCITVQFADIGHDQKYIIVGEQHRITGGGDHTHDCTWILKPADPITYWELGTAGNSELNQTTTLAF